jgi:hypothetical protein
VIEAADATKLAPRAIRKVRPITRRQNARIPDISVYPTLIDNRHSYHATETLKRLLNLFLLQIAPKGFLPPLGKALMIKGKIILQALAITNRDIHDFFAVCQPFFILTLMKRICTQQNRSEKTHVSL